MKNSEALIGARDYLMEHGWVQFETRSAIGEACATGALDATCPHVIEGKYWPEDMLREAIDELFPGRNGKCTYRCIPCFNDHSDTDFADVIEVYDRAIILAKEQEA